MNRLQKQYQETVAVQLKKDLAIQNIHAVPQVEKVVISMAIGDVSRDKTKREKVQQYISKLAGQHAQFCAAKKSIAEFGVRIGDPVGVRATLRGKRMYIFLDKLFSIVLPQVKDFQGVKRTSFDANGNYNLGIQEQIIFPEVEYDTIDRVRGLQITICTSTSDTQAALQLLTQLGMPFAKQEEE